MGRSDVRQDANKALTKQLEDEAHAFVLQNDRVWHVKDVRGRRLPWDVTFYQGQRMDYKADYKVDRTGNIAYEAYNHRPSTGKRWDSWGRNPGLDTLMVIGARTRRLWVVDVRRLRAIAEPWVDVEEALLPDGWRRIAHENVDYVTHGVCVPIGVLDEKGAIRSEGRLPSAPPTESLTEQVKAGRSA